MDRRIRPWINKKIIEYIGEEEATLVDFVCSKVCAHFLLVCPFYRLMAFIRACFPPGDGTQHSSGDS